MNRSAATLAVNPAETWMSTWARFCPATAPASSRPASAPTPPAPRTRVLKSVSFVAWYPIHISPKRNGGLALSFCRTRNRARRPGRCLDECLVLTCPCASHNPQPTTHPIYLPPLHPSRSCRLLTLKPARPPSQVCTMLGRISTRIVAGKIQIFFRRFPNRAAGLSNAATPPGRQRIEKG